MRSQTNNSITLQYPDTIGFVFNPVLVIASVDSGNITSMYIKMTCGDQVSGVSYDAFSGKCYADVREYLQAIFDDVDFGKVNYTDRVSQSDLGKTVTFDVTVYQGSDTTTEFSFTAFMIWGAMRMDGTDVYNNGRVARWFKNYPFTVGLYANDAGKVEFTTNGTQQSFVDISGQGVFNIKIDDTLITGKDYIDIIDYSSIISAATFDNTFDLTFGGTSSSSENRRMRIDIDDSANDGVYLRWVDRHGFYCYWLFIRGDEKRKTTAEETYIRNNLVDFNRSYGFLSCLNDRHTMSRVDSIPLCAPSVDSDTFDMLQDLTTSPVVDMFAGYASDGSPRWAPVTIDAGTYTKGRTVLQDFALSMTLQEIPVQSF